MSRSFRFHRWARTRCKRLRNKLGTYITVMSTTNISEMPKFIPGLKLCKLFYQKQVRPILNKEFPSLRYSAALIGWGSEVLGFDTAMSDRKSTRLNSSHSQISYAVFCLKK